MPRFWPGVILLILGVLLIVLTVGVLDILGMILAFVGALVLLIDLFEYARRR